MSTKFSQFAEDTSPATTDYAVGYKTAVGNKRWGLNDLITLFFNNIPDGAVTSAKLATAFLKGRYQSNTTNSDVSGLSIQQGWGFLLGSGTNSSSETVTLPTTFANTNYLIFVTCLGFKASDPASQADATIASSINAAAKIINAATFTLGLYDPATVMGATTRFVYSWIAIGTI